MTAILWLSLAGLATASEIDEAHEAVMMQSAEGHRALTEAENATDKAATCDAYKRAIEPLKAAVSAADALSKRLKSAPAGNEELATHLKDMQAEDKSALSAAEAGARKTCR